MIEAIGLDEQRSPHQTVLELADQPSVLPIGDRGPAPDQRFMADIDVVLLAPMASSPYGRRKDTPSARNASRIRRTSDSSVPVDGDEILEPLRTPRRLPVGVDVGQGAKDVLDNPRALWSLAPTSPA